MNFNEYLRYDVLDGTLRWAIDVSRTVRKGDIAGSYHKISGYIKIMINRKSYRANRIVWEMFNGPIPTGMVVDHINGDKTDNRICNLRAVSCRKNQQNRSSHRNGRKVGVTFEKGVYRSRIQIGSKKVSIGSYGSEEEAHQAYLEFCISHSL